MKSLKDILDSVETDTKPRSARRILRSRMSFPRIWLQTICLTHPVPSGTDCMTSWSSSLI